MGGNNARKRLVGAAHWPPCAKCLGISADITGTIYHLLRRAFGQRIAVAQIVDLDILNIISVRNIDFIVELARTLTARRRG